METEKRGPDPEYIKNLFGSISHSYDRANDFITLGLARAWRRELVEWSDVHEGSWVLDCATGTGDLAIEFKRAAGETGHVIGVDFCPGMLNLAPAKAQRHGLKLKFEVGDVLNLNYPSNEFDVVSIAYGIRNVADRRRAISEMARIAKSGGRIMVLETGEVENAFLRHAIRFYFESVVPKLGGWISGKPEAYDYLQRSSGDFPSGETFCELLESTNLFSKVEFRSLMGGASFIYKAVVK